MTEEGYFKIFHPFVKTFGFATSPDRGGLPDRNPFIFKPFHRAYGNGPPPLSGEANKKAPLRVLFLFLENIAVVKNKAAVKHKDVRAFKIDVTSDHRRHDISGINKGYLCVITHKERSD